MKQNIAWGLAAFGLMNLIFIIISTGSKEWITTVVEDGVLRISIWINYPSPGLKAVQAFMILAIIANTAGIIFSALLAHHRFTRKVFAESFYSATGIFLFIAVVIFASEFNSDAGIFGYSFSLACVCVAFSFLLSGAVEILSKYD